MFLVLPIRVLTPIIGGLQQQCFKFIWHYQDHEWLTKTSIRAVLKANWESRICRSIISRPNWPVSLNAMLQLKYFFGYPLKFAGCAPIPIPNFLWILSHDQPSLQNPVTLHYISTQGDFSLLICL